MLGVRTAIGFASLTAVSLALVAAGCSNAPSGSPFPGSGSGTSQGTTSTPGTSSGETTGSGSGQTTDSGDTTGSGQMTGSGQTSSSGQTSGSGADSSAAAASDSGHATTDGQTSSGGRDAGGCPMYPGVTLTDVDAGSSNATWSCVVSQCKAIAACEADCTCSDIIMKALLATAADPSQANSAFTTAAMTGEETAGESGVVIPVAICLQQYAPSCPKWGSGG